MPRAQKRRKIPTELAPYDLTDLLHPIARFRTEAQRLSAELPGVDSEAMARTMAIEGAGYGVRMEIHWEGSRRRRLKKLSDVSVAANQLLEAIFKLGPMGRLDALGHVGPLADFLFNTEKGEWLLKLAKWEGDLAPELDDTPFPGRPEGTTKYQKQARSELLVACQEFLRPYAEESPGTLNWLVPEMARSIHRIVCDPNLEEDSQLFRKEWEGRSVQK